MAAVAGPATPQRPLPGAYAATPVQAPTIFAASAASLRQNPQPPPADAGRTASTTTQSISAVERAARTINDTLAQEARFPELESYITQGVSGEYELPQNPAWAPFQRLKQHDLPPRLLEQANHVGVDLTLGIFAPLGHAWVALDSCLYLWDYTLPNPDLIGWEENSRPISAVKLIKPKPGVFVKEIEHLLCIVTDQEMILLGVAVQTSAAGAKTVALYNTRMSTSVRNYPVDQIQASSKSGRIFFSGPGADDIYEFQYQQEEGWFRGRTSTQCLTQTSMSGWTNSVKSVGQYFGPGSAKKKIIQMEVDDTRNLLYTLSDTSEIKVYALRNATGFEQALVRPMGSLLQNSSHFSPRSELLTGRDVRIISISVIPAAEANKIGLMATTNTGCRLYMSLMRGMYSQADGQNMPNSMQILHVRFPPRDPNAPAQPGQTAITQYGNPATNLDFNSEYLKYVLQGDRIPPGLFLAFVADRNTQNMQKIFCAAPDSARLKNPQDTSQLNQRFAEFGTFFDISGFISQVAVTQPESLDKLGATNMPLGYGNELAVQFDKPATEIAIMTSSSILTIRRRRLVDIFAGMLRFGSSDEEGRDGDIKRFVRTYGRGETAATALAVACGQGMDVTSDSRLTSITDPDVLEGAWKAFIEHGGRAEYNANAIPDNSGSPIDSVRPSPRYEGLALYISRLVRSIWKATIVNEDMRPGEVPKSVPTVKVDKLRDIQRALNSLSEFLDRNKSFIEGLAGAQTLTRAGSRQEEIAAQGEHRAMDSLVRLISSIVEGISFILVLFDERIDDILAALDDETRQKTKQLTFESLFVSGAGRALAKELVKAIVNRNIASGSNVDTVAEALRRKCGSFCSADDVVIFKAQEQVKRASEAGGQSEGGRVLLNESLRLFKKVAASLSMEHLQWAMEQYIQMVFYAGAIELSLAVASEKDRAKRALGWLKDGQPDGDSRREAFDARKNCYDLVFVTIQELEKGASDAAEAQDGLHTVAARRRLEAYDVINASDDAVFQDCLYDWYVNIGKADRLLDIDTQYVVEYLKRRSPEDRAHADLLWRYHAYHNDYLQAAAVQLDLAKGYFDLSLEQRIEYLSRARTNASTRQTALTDSRQSKQALLRSISDLLDVATIQSDLYKRMESERRLQGPRKQEVLQSLNGPILDVGELFNQYADQAGYYDICLLIYHAADHRNPADIRASWQNLINTADDEALAERRALTWEAVGEKVREMGRRLDLNDTTFPIQDLMPMLERYALAPHDQKPGPTWVPDIFLDLEIPHETLLPVLEQMFYGNEPAFAGSKRRVVAAQIVYLLKKWLEESDRKGERIPFGSEENASLAVDCASAMLRGAELDAASRRDAELLLTRVQSAMR